jgi:hypothetical protein
MKRSEKDSEGTSFHDDTIPASVAQLERVCGSPIRGSIHDKSQYDWVMETSKGDVFTIYDWKEYREYEETDIIEFHIGAHTPEVSKLGLKELTQALNTTQH